MCRDLNLRFKSATFDRLHFGPAGAHARTRTCTLPHLRPVGRQHVKLTGDDGRQAEDVGEAAVDWLVRGIFQEVVTWMEGGRKKKTSKREDEKNPHPPNSHDFKAEK